MFKGKILILATPVWTDIGEFETLIDRNGWKTVQPFKRLYNLLKRLNGLTCLNVLNGTNEQTNERKCPCMRATQSVVWIT